MKIDVFWVWFAAFVLVVMFQNFFTVKKSSYDVSYTWTTDSMEYVVYGQQELNFYGDNLPWSSVKHFLEKVIKTEEGEDASVTVLAVNKIETNRYWRPFWKVEDAS